ncbi:MAG: hypothetical protein SAK29_26280 [Scytonema sp. PMC 1069.18]|nr:hypothetical protein [Scytonema sp. PMC 1069.18]MEC4887822.1 hypothetical protein [Scytonema sp. PMC 1070.18]
MANYSTASFEPTPPNSIWWILARSWRYLVVLTTRADYLDNVFLLLGVVKSLRKPVSKLDLSPFPAPS